MQYDLYYNQPAITSAFNTGSVTGKLPVSQSSTFMHMVASIGCLYILVEFIAVVIEN